MAKKMLIQIQIVEPLPEGTDVRQETIDGFRDQVYEHTVEEAHKDAVVNVEIIVYEDNTTETEEEENEV